MTLCFYLFKCVHFFCIFLSPVPVGSTCHSWCTPCRGSPAACWSSRTATGPGWCRSGSGCESPADGPDVGPVWTAEAANTHIHTHITLNNATSHQLNQKSWTVPLKPLHVCFNAMLNLQFVTNPNFGQKSFYPHNVLTAVALCRPHLVVQHQQQSAANAHISRPFHLEAVGLLCGRCAVPLKNTKQPFKLM